MKQIRRRMATSAMSDSGSIIVGAPVIPIVFIGAGARGVKARGRQCALNEGGDQSSERHRVLDILFAELLAGLGLDATECAAEYIGVAKEALRWCSIVGSFAIGDLSHAGFKFSEGERIAGFTSSGFLRGERCGAATVYPLARKSNSFAFRHRFPSQ
jgi:hypothetical protein